MMSSILTFILRVWRGRRNKESTGKTVTIALIQMLGVQAIAFTLVITIVIGGISVLFNFISETNNGVVPSSNNEYLVWANNLTDEQIEQLRELGSTFNPRNIPKYIEIEKKGIPANITTQKKTHILEIENGSRTETTEYDDYQLDLYNTAYPYRLSWKLLAGLDSIQDTAWEAEIAENNIINNADKSLQPRYVWGYDKYSKDITNSTLFHSVTTRNGEVIDRQRTERHTTKYYPLPFLDAVYATFKDYKFTYEENVVVKDEPWSEPYNVTSRSWQKRVIVGRNYSESTDANGNIRRSWYNVYETHNYTYRSYNKKKEKIVEDILDEAIEKANPDKIVTFFNDNKTDLDDLALLYALIGEMPNSLDLQIDLGDILALIDTEFDSASIRQSVGGTGAYDFNPNIPTIEGSWTRQDLINTAMSLVDLPYFWGGKHPRKGRHPAWGKPRVVQAPNNWASSGNPIPFGMDCSGYVDWVYYQMIGKTIGRGGGTTAQFSNSYAIKESELKIGDLGFYGVGGGGHVGIYVGELNGKKLFIHSGGRTWRAEGLPAGRVVITYNKTTQRYKGNTSSRFTHFRRPYVSFANE